MIRFSIPSSWLAFLFGSLMTFSASAQFTNIVLDDGVGRSYPPCEPSIAINRKNPDIIMAGSVLDNLYVTRDGGQNWTHSTLTSSYGVMGDPCLISDSRGRMYYFHLSNPAGGWSSEEVLDRIVCQQIKKGGKKWTDGGYMGFHHPKDQDKEWAIANPFNSHIYASWTQFDVYGSKDPQHKSHILFAKSEDKGRTWSKAVQVDQFGGDCKDDDKTVEGAVPAIGPKGEVYVAWANDEKLYLDKSFDGGDSWLEGDILVAKQPGGWNFDVPGVNRANGLPVLVCDHGDGPHRGNLYLNWTDQRNGVGDTDVWLARSTDGGDTWSDPIRVNDDGPGHQQFFSWIDIDQTTGYLYVVFYDRRNHTDNATDVYLAYSKDGGKSFVNVKISDSPFIPQKAAFLGDYNHISAHKGRICPIWTRQDQGRNKVLTAVISQENLVK